MERHRRALTLIELLIALSILAVVMASIYASFHSGILGYRNIEETLQAYQTGWFIMEQLNKDLRNAVKFKNNDAGFKGADKEISFFSLVDTFLGDEIIQELSFLRYKIEGQKLFRSCWKSKEAKEAFDGDLSATAEEEMASNISKISFKYLKIDPKGAKGDIIDEAVWGDDADEEKMLPVAVAVSISLKGKIEYNFARTIYLSLKEQ